MTISSGTRLGPYEILSAIGAGGMGEVYRARDTKLGREVALKVLPEAFATDSERLARFKREAQVLASLNHPNIAAIYGLEEADGLRPPSPVFGEPGRRSTSVVRALVLELVDGPTLGDRIARGPLPLDEALLIARQLCEALEAAHEQGIVHRDLKPANIKVTPGGNVKVLDFGLAKAVAGDGSGTDFTQSATVTVVGTGEGVVLGTAAYMSPEQARGQVVDKRTDIWAFGCVLYEMLTGRQMFAAPTTGDTLVAVLQREPDWNALPDSTPAMLRTVLRRCLEKDRRRRVRDIGDVQLLLSDAFSEPTGPRPAPTRPLGRGLISVAVAFLAVGAFLGIRVWYAGRSTPPRVARFSLTSAGTPAVSITAWRDVAITPDGTRVVYVGNNGTQLFLRALDSLEVTVLASGQVRSPFVSPDGEWVGFVDILDDTATLKKVAITGGPVITLARLDGGVSGATWLADDTIVFAASGTLIYGNNQVASGLQRIAAAGGAPDVLTRPDGAKGENHLYPEALPGRDAVLFTIAAKAPRADMAATQVAVHDLRTHGIKVIVPGGGHAQYVPSGHLVYVAGGTLRAIRFDLSRLETSGTAVTVLPRLVTTGNGAGEFAVASDGTLVYADAVNAGTAGSRSLVWVDRAGREDPLPVPPRVYGQLRISPDGTRVAVVISDQEQDIWVWDLSRPTLTRVTTTPGLDLNPVWTSNGRRILFSSSRAGGPLNLWSQASDGSDVAERLTDSPNSQASLSTSPDGKYLVFQELTSASGYDLMQLTLDGSRRISPLLRTPFSERYGIVSPDGRWLAYDSNSSGTYEVYVRSFANSSLGQWQVSTAGGTQPTWGPGGKELFFFGRDGALMSVSVSAATTWAARTPTRLLEPRYLSGSGNFGRTYDLSKDGSRFLLIKAPGTDSATTSPDLLLVQHWAEELKARVPVN
jgi:eukaryotic-like serine/threonine-protein kinase